MRSESRRLASGLDLTVLSSRALAPTPVLRRHHDGRSGASARESARRQTPPSAPLTVTSSGPRRRCGPDVVVASRESQLCDLRSASPPPERPKRRRRARRGARAWTAARRQPGSREAPCARTNGRDLRVGRPGYHATPPSCGVSSTSRARSSPGRRRRPPRRRRAERYARAARSRGGGAARALPMPRRSLRRRTGVTRGSATHLSATNCPGRRWGSPPPPRRLRRRPLPTRPSRQRHGAGEPLEPPTSTGLAERRARAGSAWPLRRHRGEVDGGVQTGAGRMQRSASVQKRQCCSTPNRPASVPGKAAA